MPVARDLTVMAAAALAWLAYASILLQSEGALLVTREVTFALALALTAVLAVRLVGAGIIRVLIEPFSRTAATEMVRFVVYVLLGAAAVTLILKIGFDVNVTTLLTTSALLTAIIGLAMQPTLSAFVTGVALQIERHIQIGDAIRVDNRWAIVENMGWRSMIARRGDGAAVVVPHTMLATTLVPVRQKGSAIATELMLPGPLTLPPSQIIEILKDLIAGISGVSEDHPVFAVFAGFRLNEGIADYAVQFHTRLITTDDQALSITVRTRLWYAYQRHGIELPRSADFADPPSMAWVSPLAPEPSNALFAELAAALGRLRHWHNADPQHREELARRGRQLLFAPQEPLWPPRAYDGATALVVAGTIRVIGDEQVGLAAIEPPALPVAGVSEAAVWDSETLQPIEAQLSRIIGPYARVEVRRIASLTANPVELYDRLAELIRSPVERAAFLRDAPDHDIHDFGPGTVLRLHRIRPMRLLPFALNGVELLALPVDAA